MLSAAQQTVAEQLFEINAIKFGAFRMKLHETNPTAPLSPIYIDLRILRSFPKTMDAAIVLYIDIVKNLSFDILADVPTAATPIVAILSNRIQVPMISPRRDEKGHGIVRKIDGVFQPGQTALLVDDLITQAHSKLETIRSLEENGLKVNEVVVLVDREQGGPEQLEAAGYKFYSALKLSDILNFYLDSNKINQEQYQRTITYLKSS